MTQSKRLRWLLLVIPGLYLLYLVKTALGIDISQRYSAWNFFKQPINCRSISHYCHKT